MLAIIERYPEIEKIEPMVTPRQYELIKYRMERTRCPALIDLENGIIKPVDIDYTGRSYDLIFR